MENTAQNSQDDVLPISEVKSNPRSFHIWAPLMMRSARQRREAQRLQGRHGPTVPKNKSDVKLETFEDFREGENLKSRQLLVSFILSVLARGESKPCRSSTLSRDLFTLTD